VPEKGGEVFFEEDFDEGDIIEVILVVGVQGMYRGDPQLPAYRPGSHVEAEFGMGVDYIQVEGPDAVNDLFFQKNPNPVLGFRGKLDALQPENPFFGKGVGMPHRKHVNPVAPAFKPEF
jgi:hypothetical protein